MIKLLIGGSPCTYWSIAQTSNRETEPSGMGWELFENYLIALEKFKPDFFLYENNKSMSTAIRAEITKRFGFEPVCINSALVSAQNRQRLYWCGKRNLDGTYSRVDVEQPEDRGILLRDILESGQAWNEKSYNLTTRCCGAIPEDTIKRHRHTMVAEPVRIGTIESKVKNADFDSQQYRVYSPDGKSVTICGQGGGVGAKTGLYAVPIDGFAPGESTSGSSMQFLGGVIGNHEKWVEDGKSYSRNFGQGYRIYGVDGKSTTQTAQSCGLAGHTGLYAVPVGCDVVVTENSIRCQRRDAKHSTVQGTHVNFEDGKPQTVSTSHVPNVIQDANENPVKSRPVYEVKNGLITINGKQYPIKLADGFYIIRKLTVTECKRLQTVPDNYVFPVSDTQAYKMLGNGWTVDVIAHILSHCHGIASEPLDVLSMYDGMACGHIALDKLGAHISRYCASEIDKYAIKTACHNFPDIEQIGDAFQVREPNWKV